MELDIRRRIEVETLSDIIGNLDFYQVLKLKSGAPLTTVEAAYAEQSGKFHPDRFFGVRDPKFMRKVTKIFKKINEAYQVLKDPALKKRYDIKMGFREAGRPGGLGGSLSPTPVVDLGGSGTQQAVSKKSLLAEKQAEQKKEVEVVSDKRAKKYYDLAQIALMNKDWNGVVMNLQFALNYEADNEVMKRQLVDAKVKKAEKKAKKEENPYRIKIV